jgi:hypothetical protein
MICPFCHRTLALDADLPPPRGIGRLGDLYCVNCGWLFAVEMLGGESPMALDGIWRCPSHRGESRNPPFLPGF